MEKKLIGKVAIVTGSSSGIGEGIAKKFAEEGASVVVVSNRAVEKGQAVCEQLCKIGSDAIYCQMNVSNPDDVDRLFSTVMNKYGRLDILVNNAGGQVASPFGKTTFEMLEQDMRVNAFAPFMLSQKAAEFMGDKGWIINTSSFRSIDPRPPILGYCASKAALNNITQALALQLAPRIFVNAVLPGFVETDNYKKFNVTLKESWVQQTPIKRFVTPEEIAEVYLLLATTEILTGTLIVADGGFSLLGR